MEDKIVSNIKNDIKKSGFPLEIEVGALLSRNNWDVNHQTYFYDQEEDKARALDIVATRLELIESSRLNRINITLLIECKRSFDKPWVFYTTPKGENHEPMLGSVSFIKFISVPELELRNYGLFYQSHYFFNEIQKITTLNYEPFSERKNIFTATNQVLKALHYKRKTTKELLRKLPSHLQNIVIIYYPLIVFDGMMYECELSENDIEITPLEYIQYKVSHGISGETEETFIVDVVKKKFLDTYISWINQEIETMIHFAQNLK